MVRLINKSNTDTATSDFPYGNVRDNPGDNSGTPLNKAVLADHHQFYERMFELSGITANNLPDNATNGFQLFEAFLASVGPDQTPTYAGSYIANGTYPIKFRKVTGRKVQIRGRSNNSTPGNISADELMFTLPAAYRPVYFKDFQVFISSNNTYGRVRIETDGTVKIIYNAGSAIDRTHVHLNIEFTLD